MRSSGTSAASQQQLQQQPQQPPAMTATAAAAQCGSRSGPVAMADASQRWGVRDGGCAWLCLGVSAQPDFRSAWNKDGGPVPLPQAQVRHVW